MEDATRVLTGLSSWSLWALTNSAADALVLTGGGLGGCRSVCAKAGAAGDVRLTYSDRSTSSWGTQEPTNQSTAQHSQRSSTESTVMRLVQVKTAQRAATRRTDTHTHSNKHTHSWRLLESKIRRNTLREHLHCHQPNSVFTIHLIF